MGILTPDMKRVVVDNKRRIFPNNREKTGKITKYYILSSYHVSCAGGATEDGVRAR